MEIATTKEDLWACLVCGKVGCGKEDEGHAQGHQKALAKHCLALHVHSYQVWCFECNKAIVIPNYPPSPDKQVKKDESKPVTAESASSPNDASSSSAEVKDGEVKKEEGAQGGNKEGKSEYGPYRLIVECIEIFRTAKARAAERARMIPRRFTIPIFIL